MKALYLKIKMKPDFTYFAQVSENRKSLVMQELEKFCINTGDNTFDQNLINEDCQISFLLNDEESTQWFKNASDFSRNLPGKTIIGHIQLWIESYENYNEYKFWPASSSLGRACRDSLELKNRLITFVKNLNGRSLNIHWDDGSIEEVYILFD